MCRLAAYQGPALALQQLLLQPQHSLMQQAWQAKEMRFSQINADGFGCGWHHNGRAHRYRNIMPIWADHNLRDLSASLHSEQWLTMVRSATLNTGPCLLDSQPFCNEGWLFLHNGLLEKFADGLRSELRALLQPAFEKDIAGGTDSEYLFALLRQQLAQHEPLTALSKLLEQVDSVAKKHQAPCLVNILISNGKAIYGCRWASHDEEPPSLYSKTADNALWLASERLNHDSNWQQIPPLQLLHAEKGKALQLLPWR